MSPPGRHPGGCGGVGRGGRGHDVHDGHVDTVRLDRAGLTGPAPSLGWHRLGNILGFASSSHPLRSLTIYSWYSLRRSVPALASAKASSSWLLVS